MEQNKTTLAYRNGLCWKAFKWLFIVTLTAGVVASTWDAATNHSGAIASSCRSAAEALFPVVPYSQTYSNEDAESAVATPTTTMLQQPVTSKPFPEINQQVTVVDSHAQRQQPFHKDDSDSKLQTGLSQCLIGGSRVNSSNWALEDSLLRAAELESALASMREDSLQLSAHLLQAARQLAAVGQPVQLPTAQQTEPFMGLFSNSTAVFGMLLLILTWTLWRLLTSAMQNPATVQQQAINADNAANEVRPADCSFHSLTEGTCILPAKLQHDTSQTWQGIDSLIKPYRQASVVGCSHHFASSACLAGTWRSDRGANPVLSPISHLCR